MKFQNRLARLESHQKKDKQNSAHVLIVAKDGPVFNQTTGKNYPDEAACMTAIKAEQEPGSEISVCLVPDNGRSEGIVSLE